MVLVMYADFASLLGQAFVVEARGRWWCGQRVHVCGAAAPFDPLQGSQDLEHARVEQQQLVSTTYIRFIQQHAPVQEEEGESVARGRKNQSK
jgi:hypothetical protein